MNVFQPPILAADIKTTGQSLAYYIHLFALAAYQRGASKQLDELSQRLNELQKSEAWKQEAPPIPSYPDPCEADHFQIPCRRFLEVLELIVALKSEVGIESAAEQIALHELKHLLEIALEEFVAA